MRTADTDWLTVAEVAELLNLSVRAVQHRIKAGTITATQFGRGGTAPYVVTRAEVERVKAEAAA